MNQGPAAAEGDEAAAQKKTPKDVVDSPNLVTLNRVYLMSAARYRDQLNF